MPWKGKITQGCNWEKEKQGELYVFGINDYF